MTYTRGGRPSALVKGQPLIVEDLNMEGFLIKTFTKTGTVPKGFFQIRNGVKVPITKEEYEKLQAERSKK
jgi:hypothetical protein